MTTKVFSSRYPTLYNYLIDTLKVECENKNSLVLHSILIFFTRLYPGFTELEDPKVSWSCKNFWLKLFTQILFNTWGIRPKKCVIIWNTGQIRIYSSHGLMIFMFLYYQSNFQLDEAKVYIRKCMASPDNEIRKLAVKASISIVQPKDLHLTVKRNFEIISKKNIGNNLCLALLLEVIRSFQLFYRNFYFCHFSGMVHLEISGRSMRSSSWKNCIW